MKRIMLAVLIVALLWTVAHVRAQTPEPVTCPATVKAVPQPEGLPVLGTPMWGSTFTGLYLQVDAQLDVTGIHYEPASGQTWYFFTWGTVQAWSGSAAYVALDDVRCAVDLPLSIGVYVAVGRDHGVTVQPNAMPAPALPPTGTVGKDGAQ